jgi:nucleoside-diphosphate-sugar epimerase
VVIDTVAFSVAHAAQLVKLAGHVGSVVVISTGSVYLGTNGSYFDIGKDDATYPTFPVPIVETLPTISAETSTYGPMKAAMERALLESDLPVSILRPAAVHGPHSTRLREWFFIKRALDGRPYVVLSRNGSSRFSTSATANIAALIDACIRNPGSRVLNAVDEEGYSVRQIASTIFGLMDRDVEILGFDGPAHDVVGATPWDAPHPFVCSMEKARQEVGYVPAVTYEQAAMADIDWVSRAVWQSEQSGGDWRDVFPDIVARHGADGWFPYPAEAEWLRRRGSAH